MDTQRRSHSGILAACLVLALVTYFGMNHLMLEVLVTDFGTRGLLKTLVYLGWMFAGFVVFAAVLLTARAWVVALLFFLAAVSVTTNYAYAVIAKQDITPDYMEWMVQELGNFGNAGREYTSEILISLAQVAVCLAIFIAVRVFLRRRALAPFSIPAQPHVRAAAAAAFLAFHGAAMAWQPSYTVAETNVVVFGLPALLSVSPVARQPVTASPARAPLVEKLLLVIDESVAYDVYDRLIAPALTDVRALNYGRAASGGACSAASNALLRWGIDVSRLGEPGYDPRTNPTIWAYAKAAGFRTVLIDGQSKGASQNYLSTGELALLDEFVPADTGLQTDMRVAQMLKQRLSTPGRELIYVVKRGNHFPYKANYPEGAVPESAPLADKYAAGVSYSTGNFFRTLVPFPTDGALVIYTSDHGQNLDSRAFHCSGQNDPREYAVPLVAITGAGALSAELDAASPAMRDRASHANIFGTLLYAMGYERRVIEARYGPTLLGPPGEYIWVDGWLPHPTRRTPYVRFRKTPECPGCGGSRAG